MLSIPNEIKRLATELAFEMARGGDAELVDPMLNAVREFTTVNDVNREVLSPDKDDPIRRAHDDHVAETFDNAARILNPVSERYERAEIILALATEYLTRGDRGVPIGTLRDQVVFDVEVVTILATRSTIEGLALLIEWQAIGKGGKIVKSGRTKIPNDDMHTPSLALFLDACRNEIILREFHGIGGENPVVDVVDDAVNAFATTNGNGYTPK